MSEQLHHSPEKFTPKAESHEHHKKIEYSEGRHEHAEEIDTIRSKIEAKATAAKEVQPQTHENTKQDDHTYIHRALKLDAYQAMIKRTRAHMNGREKVLSKVIHQPAVETVSVYAGKTVARPSGILGGALTSLIGSTVVLYIAKHYGFTYNFSLFFILFVAGFCVGLLIEAASRLLSNRTRA